MARRARNRTNRTDSNIAWSRQKLLSLLLFVGVGVLVVVIGLGLAVAQLLSPTPTTQPATALPIPTATVAPAQGQPLAAGETRDDAANRPWTVPAGQSVATTNADVALLNIPKPTQRGGAEGVDSGFPHTQEGALGQLAALDQSVLTGMRLDQTRAAYATWAMPGGVGAANWIMTRNVEAFTATLASNGSDGVVVTAVPVAGQIRAADGPDWVVACVLLDVRAHGKGNAQLGYGHCERMQWSGDRWLIAPGTPPAQPGQVSIGSPQARAQGWRTLTGFGAGS